MRIGETPEDTRRLWSALPALASSVAARRAEARRQCPRGDLGVHRRRVSGRGGSKVRPRTFDDFSGEASWRWKMMLPSTDRSLRVLLAPGRPLDRRRGGRSGRHHRPRQREPRATCRSPWTCATPFAPLAMPLSRRDVTSPGGQSRPLQVRPNGGDGRYAGTLRADAPGLYRVSVDGDARQRAAGHRRAVDVRRRRRP